MRVQFLTAATIVLSLGPAAASAQRAPISFLLRQNFGDVHGLIAALRNESGDYTIADQNAVADVLTEKAISNRVTIIGEGDSASFNAAIRAVTILAQSSALEYPGMNPAHPGQPYAGGVDRLTRIAHESPIRTVRTDAMRGLLGAADRGRGLDVVGAIAETGNDVDADAAVEVLIMDAQGFTSIPKRTAAQREQSTNVLRTLSANHRVKSADASRQIDSYLRGKKP